MREHRYKAKRLDNGEWVEGYYYSLERYGGKETHHFIRTGKREPIDCFMIENIIENQVDPTTICEYTGIEDINGKEIYEGDIAKYDGEYYIVKYDVENGKYILKGNDMVLDFDYWDSSIFEIVDNIFDNSELLKESDTKPTQ